MRDASEDERFADHPPVTAAPFIRFCAGRPLCYQSRAIGTLRLIDVSRRDFTRDEQAPARARGRGGNGLYQLAL